MEVGNRVSDRMVRLAGWMCLRRGEVGREELRWSFGEWRRVVMEKKEEEPGVK
jgi:hypothetical protein